MFVGVLWHFFFSVFKRIQLRERPEAGDLSFFRWLFPQCRNKMLFKFSFFPSETSSPHSEIFFIRRIFRSMIGAYRSISLFSFSAAAWV